MTVQDNDLERNLKQLQNNYTLTLLPLIKVTKSSTGRILFFTFSPITSIYVEKRLLRLTSLCEQYHTLALSINCDSTASLPYNLKFLMNNKTGFLLFSSSSGADLILHVQIAELLQVGYLQVCLTILKYSE